MKQKIVITANMSRAAAPIAPEVTYQWHWKRIVTVMLLVVFALVIFTYSLLGSVNAEQNEQQPTDNPAPLVIAASDDEMSLVDLNHDEETELESATAAPVIAAVSENNKDDVTELVTEPERQVVAVSEPEQSETPAVISAVTADSNDELLERDGVAESVDSFADSAHVASVALGARIDTDKVSRAVLTREVVDREPVNVFKADVRFNEFTDTMAFFSELKNLQGQKVKHVWRYEDKVLASIELDVTSPRYRTFSNKTILPEQVGNWRVDVVDEQGRLLAQKEFRILAE
ncbi:MAG TPA: DUF2914 domain-containing protein [Pseudoalteromonas prydzensis]|uniref:DUF2914 domain-containing protein n=1 Tax=Pseudoalteromonas prydzensis TaxID=182141 RepID=A0A7V1D012_9GAMM|nr:DUF2914 domain-containing protein [Pseudoalteromonas prydzensis]HEA17446.1 DUF2914 domain-containing protein [Pseudoalteromonas prydzensis]